MLKNVILRDASTKKWLRFTNPVRVLVARKLEEILPLLQVVERWNNRGYYVAGYLSYEASPAFDSALETHPVDDFPLVVFGIYENVKESENIAFQSDTKQLKAQDSNLKTSLNWQQSLSKKEYIDRFQTIQNAIQLGDTYQVNFSLRQWADFQEQPIELFQKMAVTAPYGAFLDLEDYAICSASPELFFSKKEDIITTRPMKGTIARGRTNDEDLQQKELLKKSGKDRAENVMIVDMIRNDLGRIAEAGTVKTPHLYSLEKYPTVWQMTSTVTAQTKRSFSEIIAALFPCASITGAPKASTMQIIHQAEDTPRHIYTGSIGFIAPNGDMQFNVAIRTALIDKNLARVEYGMGGGITTQSEAVKEYDECQLKTEIIRQERPQFDLLETMLWTPEEGVYLLKRHLERVAISAHYFDYELERDKIGTDIKKLSFSGAQKLRLLVYQDGEFEIENQPIQVIEKPTWKVALATYPVDSNNVFLYHKTTNRGLYNSHLTAQRTVKDVILYNEKNELTESCYGNLVVELNGEFYTPPVECGLLNGTLRQELVELGWLQESILYPEDLAEADNIYIINSVRKFIKADLSNTISKTDQAISRNPKFVTQNF